MAHARLHGAVRAWLLPRWPTRWLRCTQHRTRTLVQDTVRWAYTDEHRTSLVARLGTHLGMSHAEVDACLRPLQTDLGALDPSALDPALGAVRCRRMVDLPHGDARRLVVSVVHAALVAPASTAALLDAARALDAAGVEGGGAYVVACAWEQALAQREPLAPLLAHGAWPALDVLADAAHAPQCLRALDAFPAAERPRMLDAVAARPASLVVCLAEAPEAAAPLVPAFLDSFADAVRTPAWKALVAADDAAAVRMLGHLASALEPATAAVRYEQLVGLVLLADEPPWPTGDVLVAVEAMRARLLAYLQRQWVAVRAAHGFDALANWCVKELSDALDVEVHALRRAPLAAPAARAAGSSLFAMTSAGLGDGGRAVAEEPRRGPVSLHAAALNKAAAQTAVATGHV